ncbi:MAG: GHMP kinase [Candidatus Omnitrophica bacterium]|nr:GHMP kinase [Candidatus Omnitrophota bacterium]
MAELVNAECGVRNAEFVEHYATNRRPRLIVTRTPLRISFAGGGTDLPDFYAREDGAVLSTTINHYLYVTVKPHGRLFNEGFRLNYSETEHVERLDEVKNHIARECLRFLRIDPPLYISTIADVPEFSGLGSSSSFAVGLLQALHALRGERIAAGPLAEEAAHIEIEVLRRPIGKQDHYAAAFGGVNVFYFKADGRVTVESQHVAEGVLDEMFAHLLMFWTGIRRDASTILSLQQQRTETNREYLQQMREHARQLQALLRNGFDPERFGRILDASWHLKRQLTSNMTNARIETWYQRAKQAGASGGKICGAGGGGFLLFTAPPQRQEAVRAALADLTEVPIRYEAHGSRVLLPSME